MHDREREISYTASTKMLAGEPRITKLGACSPYGEMTPFVWKGRLMRLELCDPTHGLDPFCPDITGIIRDVETGERVCEVAKGCYYLSGYLEGDTMYVLGTVMEGNLFGDKIRLYSSSDLTDWEERIILDKPGWRMYNTALTKGEEGYVLLTEFSHPAELAGEYPFTCAFHTSAGIDGPFETMSPDTFYPRDRYCGGPWMRYVAPYYYLACVTALPLYRYTNYITRTKDFKTWEVGYYNPFLTADANDRLISPRAADFSPEFIESIKTGFNINNSDIDMCDWKGKVYINYICGNQLGYYYMAEAECEGSLTEMLENFFR